LLSYRVSWTQRRIVHCVWRQNWKTYENAPSAILPMDIGGFAEDMLNVADNLSRALENVPAEARQEASQRMEQLVEGVDMTQKSLQAALERHGIKQIGGKGEKFDHNLHQAVAQIPSNEVASGLVAEVIQNGYTLGDRTLRAAIVAVSTGASASSPAASEPEQKTEPGSTIDTKA